MRQGIKAGEKATARLQEMISSDTARVIEKDYGNKYGRMLAKLTVNGRDVGPTLIGEGLAWSDSGGNRESWCG